MDSGLQLVPWTAGLQLVPWTAVLVDSWIIKGSLGLYGLSKEALNSVDYIQWKFSSERRFDVLWSKFILKKLDN